MSQTINVDITPNNFQPTLNYSQGDVGRTFSIKIVSQFGDTLPAGATVKIQATKPSGFGFDVTADSVTDNVATFTTTAEMTDEWGRFPAQLDVTKDAVTIFSAKFLMVGAKNTHPEGTIDGSQGTIIPELTLLVERVEAAASSVLDMEVEAQTLPAGSQATYSYDEDTNTATFGIPQGEAGAGAAGVTASAYSASKTYAVGDYVIHNSNLYRCTTAITTAEAFTAAHWTQVVLGDDVTDLKSDLINTNKGKESFNLYGTFVNGSLTNGSLNTSTKYRVATDTIMSFNRDLHVAIDSDYRIGIHTFVNGSFSADSGWKTGTLIIPSGTNFKIVIAKIASLEDASSTADVASFVNKVMFFTENKDSTNSALVKFLNVLDALAYTAEKPYDVIDDFFGAVALPKGYTKYNYVYNNTNQMDAMVNTQINGAYMAERYATRCKFAYTGSLYSGSTAIYGLRGGTGATGVASGRVLWLLGGDTVGKVGFNYNGANPAQPYQLAENAIADVLFKNKQIIINGSVLYSGLEGTFNPYTDANINIFGVRTGASYEMPRDTMKIYAFDIFDTLTGNYVAKFIPCTNENGVAGFYDGVRDLFITAYNPTYLTAGN